MKFSETRSEYKDLKSLSDPWNVTYFLKSRRLGAVLGINPLGSGPKVCSFDCVYCELGTTELRMNELKKQNIIPNKEELFLGLQQSFTEITNAGNKFDHICVSGNGEPTLHPDIDEIMQEVKRLRDQFFPGLPIAIMTNGSHLDTRKALRAVTEADLKMIKLDAGNDKILRSINQPLVKDNIEKLITNARRLKGVIIQSCFVNGTYDNTGASDIDDWMESIGMIKPDDVHIYTIERVPSYSGVLKTDEDTLYTIAAKLEKKTRIKAKVFFT